MHTAFLRYFYYFYFFKKTKLLKTYVVTDIIYFLLKHFFLLRRTKRKFQVYLNKMKFVEKSISTLLEKKKRWMAFLRKNVDQQKNNNLTFFIKKKREELDFLEKKVNSKGMLFQFVDRRHLGLDGYKTKTSVRMEKFYPANRGLKSLLRVQERRINTFLTFGLPDYLIPFGSRRRLIRFFRVKFKKFYKRLRRKINRFSFFKFFQGFFKRSLTLFQLKTRNKLYSSSKNEIISQFFFNESYESLRRDMKRRRLHLETLGFFNCLLLQLWRYDFFLWNRLFYYSIDEIRVFIKAGKVQVNGVVLSNPYIFVKFNDLIQLDFYNSYMFLCHNFLEMKLFQSYMKKFIYHPEVVKTILLFHFGLMTVASKYFGEINRLLYTWKTIEGGGGSSLNFDVAKNCMLNKKNYLFSESDITFSSRFSQELAFSSNSNNLFSNITIYIRTSNKFSDRYQMLYVYIRLVSIMHNYHVWYNSFYSNLLVAHKSLYTTEKRFLENHPLLLIV